MKFRLQEEWHKKVGSSVAGEKSASFATREFKSKYFTNDKVSEKEIIQN